jgi:hypothetical protein
VVPIAVEDKMRIKGFGRGPTPLEFGGGEVKGKKRERETKMRARNPLRNPKDLP